VTHLWEIKHPYYCNEGNFYKNGPDVHTVYASWGDFFEDWGTADEDWNAVFRWDWKRADPDDYEPGDEPPADQLCVYWVLQRKAILRSTACNVTEADEPAVRAWLTTRAEHTRRLWVPLLDAPAEAA